MLNEKLEFPVTFPLKIITENVENDEWFESQFQQVFKKLDIQYGPFRVRSSRKATYNSFTVEITVNTQSIFTELYQKIGSIKHIRMVI